MCGRKYREDCGDQYTAIVHTQIFAVNFRFRSFFAREIQKKRCAGAFSRERALLVTGRETMGALNIRLENGGEIQLLLKTPCSFPLHIFEDLPNILRVT